MKTLNIELTAATVTATYAGGLSLEIIGRSVNDVSHKVVIELPPSSVGYLGERLHGGMRTLKDQIEKAHNQLKGE